MTGNLKFDATPAPAQTRARPRAGARHTAGAACCSRRARATAKKRCCSTRCRACSRMRSARRSCRAIPQRFDEVAALLETRAIRYVSAEVSREPLAAETRVLLGDSMGEMVAYYAACDVAFIGGSLLPFGGQNLIEACAVGTPGPGGPAHLQLRGSGGESDRSGRGAAGGNGGRTSCAGRASFCADPARSTAWAERGARVQPCASGRDGESDAYCSKA